MIAIITAGIISYFILSPVYRSSMSLQVLFDTNIKLDDVLFILTSDYLLKKAAEKINLDYGIEKIKEQVKKV